MKIAWRGQRAPAPVTHLLAIALASFFSWKWENVFYYFYFSAAEQLYLAVENRCDLNYVQLDTPREGNKNTFLEMENDEAEQCLRQSAVRNNCEKGVY